MGETDHSERSEHRNIGVDLLPSFSRARSGGGGRSRRDVSRARELRSRPSVAAKGGGLGGEGGEAGGLRRGGCKVSGLGC